MSTILPLPATSILEMRNILLPQHSNAALDNRAETPMADDYSQPPFQTISWDNLYAQFTAQKIYWLVKEAFISSPSMTSLILDAIYFRFSSDPGESLVDNPLGVIRFRSPKKGLLCIELLKSQAYKMGDLSTQGYVKWYGKLIIDLFVIKLGQKDHETPTNLETLSQALRAALPTHRPPQKAIFFGSDMLSRHSCTVILERTLTDTSPLKCWLKLCTLNEENQEVRKQIIQLPSGKEELRREDPEDPGKLLVSPGIVMAFQAKAWNIYQDLLKCYTNEWGIPSPNTLTKRPGALQQVLHSLCKKNIFFIETSKG